MKKQVFKFTKSDWLVVIEIIVGKTKGYRYFHCADQKTAKEHAKYALTRYKKVTAQIFKVNYEFRDVLKNNSANKRRNKGVTNG